MKGKTIIKDIQKAVTYTNKSVGKNTTLPILSCILVRAKDGFLEFISTNLHTGVSYKVPAQIEKEGEVAIPADLLSQFFTSIGGNQKGDIEFELIENILSFKSSSTQANISTQDSIDFPELPVLDGISFNIKSSVFVESLRGVVFSASNSEVKPEISSVYIYSKDDVLYFVATDAFRLAEKTITIKGIPDIDGILIPAKHAGDIIRIFDNEEGDVEISFTKNQCSISNKNLYVTTRLIDGQFPDYTQIIPKEHTTEAVVLVKDFINSLKLSHIFSNNFHEVKLTLSPLNKEFELYVKNSDTGESSTHLIATLSGEEIFLMCNIKYLLDVLQNINSDSVSLSFFGEKKPMLLRGIGDKKSLYLIMPISR
ncbi:MAG: DNA polymerase-3 subunit beta [Flavobacteriaceae bacterium]|jgi:DNA polymerase-3 subunit beta